MKTSHFLASIALGLSLIASANVPRPTPVPTAPVQLAPVVITASDRDVATRALLIEQRKALVAEARRRIGAPGRS